ncbi:MAG: acyl-ACP thioesterase [Treponema sp.]|jgi:acyl-ACP thioesterase|nr:acyl-ACP thioesterase [Treponema sp.]
MAAANTTDIFSETASVRFGDIDGSDTLTLAAVFDFFQEAAISHAEILGVGREAMMRTGRVWVLSRLSVFMESRPRFGETVTVQSWPRNRHRLFAVRDYNILDKAGKPAVRGRGGWLIVDLEKRRPLRPQEAMEQLSLNEGINALPLGASGDEAPPALPPRFADPQAAGGPVPRRVCYSDLDYNGHMNNTRYVQWIQDLLDRSILESAKQLRIDINYLSEALYGEELTLLAAPMDGEGAPAGRSADYPAAASGAFAVEGRRDGQAVFRAELRTGA